MAFLVVIPLVFFIYFYRKNLCNYRSDYEDRIKKVFRDEYRRKNYNFYFEKNTQYFSKYIVKPTYRGVVINKFINECNHGHKIIDIGIGDSVMMFNLTTDFRIQQNILYDYISIGDSLIKEKDEIVFTVKKNENGYTESRKFDLN